MKSKQIVDFKITVLLYKTLAQSRSELGRKLQRLTSVSTDIALSVERNSFSLGSRFYCLYCSLAVLYMPGPPEISHGPSGPGQ